MAITNRERVEKALDLLRDGLAGFAERELKNVYGEQARSKAAMFVGEDKFAKKTFAHWDSALLMKLLWEAWNAVFDRTLGKAERNLVAELRETRNQWAHQQPFSSPDALRALDSAQRLLDSIGAPQAEDVRKMYTELQRTVYEEQLRTEKRKTSGTAIESEVTGTLKPWREVVNPHKDVASGGYQQAEFAADLWQVHIGEGTDEYGKPAEFFRRTFLTDSLSQLLVGAVQRLGGKGGDPVVQLQTNFGGGKTHSMLALYHLFSGTKPGELAGIEEVLKAAGVEKLPKVNRVVLVGNKISPGNPVTKADGTVVRTLWGELAWQLGEAAGGVKEAKKAFKRVAADDEKATSPGDALRELFNDYGPSLILIDEWVAYARQLHDQKDLPAGDFETHFSFAQVLTESAKAARHCLLVISLPASDSTGSPHAQADDAEVGGQRGRAALERLKNAVGRVESSWRPASAEEGFEIVRRRLFEPLVERQQFVARDAVARAFSDMYRASPQEFPAESRQIDYEKRIIAAYPIHPEIFDRLYSDWATLLKFQRTRGVLRLMAAVIHSLWEKGDRNPLILPSTIPIDDQRVLFELTRYLPDNWAPVIEKDVDGPSALPLRLDGEVQNLGKYHACRRVARTVYLGSAPTVGAANRGIEGGRIRLGCVIPGESPAIFGDALRRLSTASTYLYGDQTRHWYDTQPTVTKMAEDRAEELKRKVDVLAQEVERRVREDLRRNYGDFRKVHPFPQSEADVPDEMETRLVVLGLEHPYTKEQANPAEQAARKMLAMRGTAPRLYQNSLVFVAVDKTRRQDLDEATARFLAWDRILAERDTLNLSPFQVKQAETQHKHADTTVTAQIPEAYRWLLAPVQGKPQGAVEWQVYPLVGQEPIALRASKKLRGDESLIVNMAGTRLRMELDKIPLWRGESVEVRQLAEDFARYVYLPRLRDPSVLIAAILDGVELLTWSRETFAYADGYDEEKKRYRGLRGGNIINLSDDDPKGRVVKPDVALAQMEAEKPAPKPPTAGGREEEAKPALEPPPPPKQLPRRFHGSVALDPERAGRDAGRVAEEVVSHLVGLVGAEVEVTLDISARVPDGVPDNVVRIVMENARALKFESQGFEKE